MKLYTLKYDCNRPTKQQINVPTNTDYKVGVKIVRNGKEQRLATSEVTLGTLSADADKINGYIAFTEKAGDDTSCAQKELVIEHGYEYDDVYKHTGQFPATNPGTPNGSQVYKSFAELGLLGYEIPASSFVSAECWIYNNPNPIPEDLSGWSKLDSFDIGGHFMIPYQVGYEGDVAVYAFDTSYGEMDVGLTFSDGTKIEHEGFWFVDYKTGDTTYTNCREAWRITENSYLYRKQIRFNANYYYGQAIKLTVGTPFSAKFNLVENIYKSQCGDIGQAKTETSTADFSGKFADGTDFDYKLVID